MQTPYVKFTKMHGCGNNYIYVWLPDMLKALDAEALSADELTTLLQQKAIEWSRQGFGIGSDGLITIEPSDVADFRMRIFNNDGSEAMMCGNGVRCCGKFVHDKGYMAELSQLRGKKLTDVVAFDTLAGTKVLQLFMDKNDMVESVRVDMGIPELQGSLRLTALDREFSGAKVSMGNPHFVIVLDEDVETFDIAHYGAVLEKHEAFPDGCNIEFANILPDGNVRMRVWERGSGITMACGTGACATAVALCAESVKIKMDGGTLKIDWDGEGEHLFMTGPAVTVFEGQMFGV